MILMSLAVSFERKLFGYYKFVFLGVSCYRCVFFCFHFVLVSVFLLCLRSGLCKFALIYVLNSF